MRYDSIELTQRLSKFSAPVYTDYGKDLLLHMAMDYHYCKIYMNWRSSRRRYGSNRYMLNSLYTCYLAQKNGWLSKADGKMGWDPEDDLCKSVITIAIDRYKARECSTFEVLSNPKPLAYYIKEKVKAGQLSGGGKVDLNPKKMTGETEFIDYGMVYNIFAGQESYAVRDFTRTHERPAEGTYEHKQATLPFGASFYTSPMTAFDFADMPIKKAFPTKDVYLAYELLLGHDPALLKKRYGRETYEKIVGEPKDVFSEEMTKIKSRKIIEILEHFKTLKKDAELETKSLLDRIYKEEQEKLNQKLAELTSQCNAEVAEVEKCC